MTHTLDHNEQMTTMTTGLQKSELYFLFRIKDLAIRATPHIPVLICSFKERHGFSCDAIATHDLFRGRFQREVNFIHREG